jgi:hypothetical protein
MQTTHLQVQSSKNLGEKVGNKGLFFKKTLLKMLVVGVCAPKSF